MNDPYRWMEAKSAERDAWFAAQNDYARQGLARLPGRDLLRNELREASRDVERFEVLKVIGDRPRLFAMRRGPTDESAKLVLRDGWNGPEHILVDPNERTGRSHVAVNFAYPSPDGRYVAYGVSSAGSEEITLEIVEVASRRVLRDRITRVRAVTIAWRPDGRSFYYSRRAKPQLDAIPADRFKDNATYLHTIGSDPDTAVPVIAAGTRELGLTSHAGTRVELTPGSRWALANVQVGVVDRAFFVAPLTSVRPGATRWRSAARASDKVSGMLVHDNRLYALTYSDAPNYRIISFDARSGTLSKAEEFVEASNLVLIDFAAARDAMYVVALDRGVHRLFRVSWRTGAREEVALPFEGTVRKMVSDATRPGLVFSMEGWTQRPLWFRLDPPVDVRELPVVSATIGVEGLIAEQVIVPRPDGAAVPLSIVRHRENVLDGNTAVLLNGYGAYGVPTTPTYNPFTPIWVRRGGLYAFCHVRGGGERGKEWHLAGIKQKKETGIDDFIACAEYLVRKKYTSPTRMTAIGISAGGIVVGGAITKRPELFTAAVLRVPVVNLVRFETTETGPINSTEYGSLSVEAEFHSILASDPYHRIRDGVDYPAILLTAGLHDVRVPAWVPAKFAARLQATGRARPTFLRIDFDEGHGLGATQTQRQEEYADIYAFAFWRSAIEVKEQRPTERRE